MVGARQRQPSLRRETAITISPCIHEMKLNDLGTCSTRPTGPEKSNHRAVSCCKATIRP